MPGKKRFHHTNSFNQTRWVRAIGTVNLHERRPPDTQ
jgi:hypothetical protein